MNFEIDSKQLLKSVAPLARVINTKSPIQILTDFMFKVNESGVFAMASNADCAVNLRLPDAQPIQYGKCCVDSKFVMDMLRKSKSVVMSVEAIKEGEVTFSHLFGEYSIPGHNVTDYPQFATVDDSAQGFRIDSRSLSRGLNSVLMATSDNAVRPVMCCVYMDIYEDKVVFVASDTHILSKFADTTIQSGLRGSLLLTAQTCRVLLGLLPEDCAVQIDFTAKRVRFKTDSFDMVASLIEGKFPDYNRVIPSENPHKIEVDRESFMSAIDRVSLCSGKSMNAISLTFNDKQITIKACDLDYSRQAVERVSCESNCQGFTISVNAENLLRILQPIETDKVLITASASERPILISPVSDNAEDYINLSMPLMLND
jgi:DNA polymerase-3 subunit beta